MDRDKRHPQQLLNMDWMVRVECERDLSVMPSVTAQLAQIRRLGGNKQQIR